MMNEENRYAMTGFIEPAKSILKGTSRTGLMDYTWGLKMALERSNGYEFKSKR